jgi:hypothetical protein
MNETRYPLCWPANWKRTRNRTRAAFHKTEARGGTLDSSLRYKSRLSLHDAIKRIAGELARMGVKEEDCIVSTDIPLSLTGIPRGDRGEPADPGVAIYWLNKGKQQCMAIDRYDRVADNLAAIAATLEALRAIERHGGGSILERAFLGFLSLPVGPQRSWRVVLGLTENDHLNRDAIETRYRALARMKHPDAIGGSHSEMAELNAAREAALQEFSA